MPPILRHDRVESEKPLYELLFLCNVLISFAIYMEFPAGEAGPADSLGACYSRFVGERALRAAEFVTGCAAFPCWNYASVALLAFFVVELIHDVRVFELRPFLGEPFPFRQIVTFAFGEKHTLLRVVHCKWIL